MAAKAIITRGTVTQMVSLLDWVYRLGVDDAASCDDSGRVRELMERTDKAGAYGFLGDDYAITWQEWALRLMAYARGTSWDGAMTRYFTRAGAFGANYLSVFYNVAHGFYLMGVTDYMSARGDVDLALFRAKRRVRLTPQGKPKNFPMRQVVDAIQLMTFDYQRRDERVIAEAGSDYKARKVALKPNHYGYFRQAVGLAVMKRL